MIDPAPFLSPLQAARRLGISPKALRLYERRGLIAPPRTEAGWRAYGPADMAMAEKVTRFRALGLSLAQVAETLGGDDQTLASLLGAHQEKLSEQARQIAGKIEKVRALRVEKLASPQNREARAHVAFELPWPWGGERFAMTDIRQLNYITGPLGCGKTRLAAALAEQVPDAVFLGLDRLDVAAGQLACDPALSAQVGQTVHGLVEAGATKSVALCAMVAALHKQGAAVLVIDLVEQGLDQASQRALIAFMRRRAAEARPVFLTTRSSAILDMAALGPDEALIHCPANHSPPTEVTPCPGASGYEAVASCLASPEVRARTAGVVACGPGHMN